MDSENTDIKTNTDNDKKISNRVEGRLCFTVTGLKGITHTLHLYCTYKGGGHHM